MMVNKLITAALIASLGAPVAAMAAQQFGRDSVYAAPGTTVPTVSSAAGTAHPGRDSVYATAPVGRMGGRSTAGHMPSRYGRA